MIIATIGHTQIKLDTLQDAEALLNIFNRAELIETSFDSKYRDYAYIKEGDKRISIEITEGDRILSLDEHTKIAAERRENAKKSETADKTPQTETA